MRARTSIARAGFGVAVERRADDDWVANSIHAAASSA
jgi:hypothetical protein